MARSFSMISTTISGSQKLRSIDDHKAKYLYLMALASPLASFCGLYRYPVGIAAHDAQLTIQEAAACFDDLTRAGLIDFEAVDEVVRITNWFSVNAPTNADHALRLTREFGKLDIGSDAMRCAAFAEFLMATLSAIPRWKPEKVENLLKELRPLVSRMTDTYDDVFLGAISDEIPRAQAFVRKEVAFLVPGFSEFERRKHTLSTPCQHRGHTQDDDETITETITETGFPPEKSSEPQPKGQTEVSDMQKIEANGTATSYPMPRPETLATALARGI